MCTTLALRLMSGEGCVNFDRHVCLCLLTALPASSVQVFFKVCKDQQFCLQRQLYLSFLIACISLPLKWIFVKLRKETEGYSSNSQSGGTLIRDMPIYESCHQGAVPALICARGGDKPPCTGRNRQSGPYKELSHLT